MSRLSKRVSLKARQGRSMPAVVVDVFFDKVTVKLGEDGSGAVYHGLKCIGGPPEVGDIVDVNFTTSDPTVGMRGKEWLTESDLARALSELTNESLTAQTQLSIVLFSGGSIADQYPASSEGFTSALGDSNPGDVVWLPDVDVEGEFTIPEGTAVSGINSRQSIIRGKVTLAGGILENLCVLYGEFNGSDVVALTVIPGDESSIVRRCEIQGYNCDGGNGYAIDVAASAELFVEHSTIVADSSTGQAWAVKGASGSTCHVKHSSVYGKTDMYTGDGIYVGDNYEYKSEIERGCQLPTDISRSFFSSGNVSVQINSMYASLDPSGLVPGPITPDNFHNSQRDGPGVLGASMVCGVLRNGNYVYVHDDNYLDGYYIKEWNIALGAGTSIKVFDSTSPTGTFCFCLVDDQKILAFGPDAAEDPEIRLVDFSVSPIPAVTTYKLFDEPEPTLGVNDFASTYPPDSMIAVQDINGDIILVCQGVYGEGISGERTYWGTYILAKNYTQDSGWTETYKVFDNDYYDTDVPLIFCPPLIVRNEKVVYPVSQGSDASSSDPTHRRIYFGILDLSTFSYSHIKRTTTNLSYGYDSAIYVGSAGNDEGLAFAVVGNGVETANDAVYKIDPYGMTVDENYFHAIAESAAVLLMSKNEAYAFDADAGAMYQLGGLVVVELWTGWSAPTNFYPHDALCIMVDDNNRFWFYDDSSGTLLRGIKIDDINDEINFDCGITYPTTSPRMMPVILLGDRFVLAQRLYAAKDVHYYLVQPS